MAAAAVMASAPLLHEPHIISCTSQSPLRPQIGTSFGNSSCWNGNRRNLRPLLTRRRHAVNVRAMAAAGEKQPGRFYFNVTGFPFPLGPFLQRRTIRKEVERGKIWTFEQEQALGFSSVTTNTRMTVIKLKTGGLWVHAPIAPTEECIQGDSY